MSGLSAVYRQMVRTNIYPVPDPAFPWLGVHFTPTTDGEVLLGPNAVLATKREGYRYQDINLKDMAEIACHRGLQSLALNNLKFGISEMYRDWYAASEACPPQTGRCPQRRPLPSPVWTQHRAVKQGQSVGCVGTTYQGKGMVCREATIAQAGRGGALSGERPMGTATYGGKGFKERTGVSGERPTGAASFRQQSIQVSCQPRPPLPPCRDRGVCGNMQSLHFRLFFLEHLPPPPPTDSVQQGEAPSALAAWLNLFDAVVFRIPNHNWQSLVAGWSAAHTMKPQKSAMEIFSSRNPMEASPG